jgi:hypothetical protein
VDADHARSPLRERVAAVLILVALIAGAGWGLLAPLGDALVARDEARTRLAHDQTGHKGSQAIASYNPAEIAALHTDDGQAQLALQSVLDQEARAASLSVETLRPANVEALGDLGRVVWVELDARGDLQALSEFLGGLDRQRPLVLIRALDAEAGPGERPDSQLRIRIEAGRVWRIGAGS